MCVNSSGSSVAGSMRMDLTCYESGIELMQPNIHAVVVYSSVMVFETTELGDCGI